MKWLSNFISGRQESVSYGMVESNPKPRCSQMAFLRGDEKKKLKKKKHKQSIYKNKTKKYLQKQKKSI